MIPQEIIEFAVQGGWNSFFAKGFTWNNKGLNDIDGDFTCYAEIICDSDFWQALGRVCKWEGTINKQPFATEWENYAHALYNLILTKQNTAPFWQEIINSKK